MLNFIPLPENLSEEWKLLLPAGINLKSTIGDVQKVKSKDSMEPFHTMTTISDGIKSTFIGIPSNWHELRDNTLVQLMALVWNGLGYIPHMLEDKPSANLNLTTEQKDIVQGIYLFISNGKTKDHSKNLRGKLKIGYNFAAYKHLYVKHMKTEYMKCKTSTRLVQVLVGSAWAKLLGGTIEMFDRHLELYLQAMEFIPRSAMTWYTEPEYLRPEFLKGINLKDNNLFSSQEVTYVLNDYRELLGEIQHWTYPDIKSRDDQKYIFEAILGIQRKLGPLKRKIQQTISARIPIYLGSANREKARNKKKPRQTRLTELKNSTEMWIKFQPAMLGKRQVIFSPPNVPYKDEDLYEWNKLFSNKLEEYCKVLGDIPLSILSVNWWGQYQATINS
jgi:hypothetical protein